MRCPKCGFISFDHLETCLKCHKDIKSVSDTINGSVYNVTAPTFLKYNEEPEPEEMELDEAFVDDGDIFSDDEIRDPDLDILMEDKGEGDEAEIEMTFESGEAEVKFEGADEPEEEIGFQFEDFDDDSQLPEFQEGEDELSSAGAGFDLPDELTDMSDLEPPELATVNEEPLPSENDFDLDLDLDLDVDLKEEEPEAPAQKVGSVGLADLDLEGLDFEEEPAPVQLKKPSAKQINLDDDLDFELDLGDLKLDDDDKF